MKKIWLFALFFSFSSVVIGKTFSLIHYNIKELDSKKIEERSPQLLLALDIIKKYPFDFLSLNELQYDWPGIPYPSLETKGKNLDIIGQYLGLDFFSLFHSGNTGKRAKKRDDGLYWPNLKSLKARRFADPINFGIFPGQYGLGSLFKYPLKKKRIISELKWRDFDPSVRLENYRDAFGNRLSKDMLLFDKAFIHGVLDVKGQDLHFVLLHSVPAYNFGNPRSVNIKRNAAQLKFLEWFLTGKTNEVLGGINPLPRGTPFIAVGDFNVDYRDKNKEGAFVMRSLLKKVSMVGPLSHTYEGPGFEKKPRTMLLDYILYGGGLSIKNFAVHGTVSQRKELGCLGPEVNPPSTADGKVLLHKLKGRKKCYFEVNKNYFDAKSASDHFLIWAKFDLDT
ncbi:MAG: endonuclease/exonuclease/phosphatase family protein [Bdellovibrionota bacterium]|nr:endonuclease/exonuclease/phosphatase family protein [Bdellovibrionota bacterium]